MVSRLRERVFPMGIRQVCPIVIVDIADFSSPARDEEIREGMNGELHKVIGDAVAGSGIDWKSCYEQDEGDGVLVVMPPTTCPDRLVDPLPRQLRFQLRRYNHKSSEAAQMRLRAAVHLGFVKRTAHGMHSGDIIDLSRMLNADLLRQALDESGAELAIAFSDFVYRNVVVRGPSMADQGQFTPFECVVKKTPVRGWLQIPGADG